MVPPVAAVTEAMELVLPSQSDNRVEGDLFGVEEVSDVARASRPVWAQTKFVARFPALWLLREIGHPRALREFLFAESRIRSASGITLGAAMIRGKGTVAALGKERPEASRSKSSITG